MKVKFRLKKNEDFQKVIRDNKKVSNQVYILYRKNNSLDHIRVGISTSKKLGCAVIRNRIRRQVRVMVVENFNFNESCDYIIIVRKKYLDNTYQENKDELKRILSKIKEK